MPRAAILHGDCLDLMPQFPANSIDLVLSDLPYGTTQNAWDRPIPFEPMWRELRRVAKPDAAIVLMAAQPFASELVCSNSKEFRYDLIWRKNKPTGFLNAKRQPLRTHEHLMVFYRDLPVYNPQMSQNHAPGHRARRAAKSSNYGAYASTEYGGSTERYPTSIIDIPVINNDSPDKWHPTQKPVALMEWLVATYTDPDAVVLDIACGSGTTGLACLNLQRRFIGFERNPDYARRAQERLADAAARLREENT